VIGIAKTITVPLGGTVTVFFIPTTLTSLNKQPRVTVIVLVIQNTLTIVLINYQKEKNDDKVRLRLLRFL
jgi:hypothetical protein